jgi:predicted DCC family thiol-disulfide oxidoreductase YuxK
MQEESGEIVVYGDNDCGVCTETKADLSSHTQGKANIKYRYVDINSDEGQHYLEHKGVKPGQKTSVPHIKACKIETQSDGSTKKKCADVDNYDKKKWESVKEGKMPDLSYQDE